MLTFAKLSVICWLFYGGMAELVDALDSKSCGLRPCQFESDYPYQIEKPWFVSRLFLFAVFSFRLF